MYFEANPTTTGFVILVFFKKLSFSTILKAKWALNASGSLFSYQKLA